MTPYRPIVMERDMMAQPNTSPSPTRSVRVRRGVSGRTMPNGSAMIMSSDDTFVMNWKVMTCTLADALPSLQWAG